MDAKILNLKDAELDALRAGDAVVVRTAETIYFVVSGADVGTLADHLDDDPDTDAEVVREVVESREVV